MWNQYLEPSIENYEEDENIEEINESEQGKENFLSKLVTVIFYALKLVASALGEAGSVR